MKKNKQTNEQQQTADYLAMLLWQKIVAISTDEQRRVLFAYRALKAEKITAENITAAEFALTGADSDTFQQR